MNAPESYCMGHPPTGLQGFTNIPEASWKANISIGSSIYPECSLFLRKKEDTDAFYEN